MSKPLLVKRFGIFTKAHKISLERTKIAHQVENPEANSISLTEVLMKLKELDRVDNLLDKMVTSISTPENSILNERLTANKRYIEEAETCITVPLQKKV